MPRITHLARMIATNTELEVMADHMDIKVNSVNYTIRRYAYFLVSTLPTSKYTMLKDLLDKNRPIEDVAILVNIPIALANSAKRLHETDAYPSPKQLGS